MARATLPFAGCSVPSNVAWHLLSGAHVAKSLEKDRTYANSQHWYSYVLLDAVAAKFTSAMNF
jgi:hypothetical protein